MYNHTMHLTRRGGLLFMYRSSVLTWLCESHSTLLPSDGGRYAVKNNHKRIMEFFNTIFQNLLALLCLILLIAYFARQFHFGLEWFKYVGRNEDKALEAWSKTLDKHSWILLLGGAACAFLYKWLYM